MMASDILTYLISVSIATTVLYGLYAILLRKQTHFKLNRIYILGFLIVSLLIPFLEIRMEATSDPMSITNSSEYRIIPNIAAPIYQQLNGFEQYDYSPISPRISPLVLTLGDVVFFFYCTISILLLLRLLTKIRRIRFIIRQSKNTEFEGSTALLHPEMPVSSFLFYIFWKKDHHPLDHLILAHEHAHIKQFHTVDILFIELLSTVFWFNPVLVQIRKELQLIHEYLADDAVLNQHQNKEQYAALICNQINHPKPYLIQAFHSFVPNRLRMMYRHRSANKSYFNYILFLPIVAGLVALLSKADAQNMLYSVAQSVDKIQGKNIVSMNIPGSPAPMKILQWGSHTIPFQANTRNIPGLKTSMRLQLQDLKALSKQVIYLHEEGTKNPLRIVGAYRFDPNDQRKPFVFRTSKTKRELTIPEILSASSAIAHHTLFRISLMGEDVSVTLDLTILNATTSKNYLAYENHRYFQTLFNDGPSYPNFIDRANLVTTEELARILESSHISSVTEGIQRNFDSYEIYSLPDLGQALNQAMLISNMDHSKALDKSELISALRSSKNLQNPIALIHHNESGMPYLTVFATELPLALQYQQYHELYNYESNDHALLLKVNQDISFSWGLATFNSVPRNQLFHYSSYAPPIFDKSIRAQDNRSQLETMKQMLSDAPRLVINNIPVHHFGLSFKYTDHLGVPLECVLSFEDGRCTKGKEDLDKVLQNLKTNDFIEDLNLIIDSHPMSIQKSIKIATKEEFRKL